MLTFNFKTTVRKARPFCFVVVGVFFFLLFETDFRFYKICNLYESSTEFLCVTRQKLLYTCMSRLGVIEYLHESLIHSWIALN